MLSIQFMVALLIFNTHLVFTRSAPEGFRPVQGEVNVESSQSPGGRVECTLESSKVKNGRSKLQTAHKRARLQYICILAFAL